MSSIWNNFKTNEVDRHAKNIKNYKLILGSLKESASRKGMKSKYPKNIDLNKQVVVFEDQTVLPLHNQTYMFKINNRIQSGIIINVSQQELELLFEGRRIKYKTCGLAKYERNE